MKLLPIASIVTLSISNASAQNFEPAPYNLTDGFAITPQVSATVRHDDNIYNDEQNGKSSSIFVIKPSITFGTDDGINRYGGLYELTSATYGNSSNDNFLDHKLELLAHTEFSAKQRTDFKLGFSNTHEDRGSDLTEGDASIYDEPLKYNEFTARGYYQFGGLTSVMRVGGGVSYAKKTYQNFTEDTKYSDVDGLKVFTDADYQLGDVTFLTFDLYSTNIQYDHLAVGDDSSDNQDTRVYLGMKWEGLGKTTGTMKAGYQYKDFDSDNRENFSGNTLDLGLTWQALEYSSLTAHLKRTAEDSDTIGDYIETLGASLDWQHSWTDAFSSSLQYIYTDENYIGATRNDDTQSTALYLNYGFTRWVKVTAGYEYTTKDSNTSDISYDKNALSFSVVVAL